MCFSISLTKSAFERDPRFHYLLDEYPGDRGYHIFGFDYPRLPILLAGRADHACFATWGLIPSWAGKPEKAESIRGKTLNARGETLGVKPSFRDSWPEKRCLIPVEGFYEPQLSESGRTPWYICRKDKKLFFLGGIYQDSPTVELPLCTFSIITVPAEGLLAEVHNDKLRMPLILSGSREGEWLDPGISSIEPTETFWGMPQEDLEAWPVDRTLFNSHNDTAAVKKRSRNWNQNNLF